jgi:hypothetical protein
VAPRPVNTFRNGAKERVSDHHRAELDRHFTRLERKMPPRLAKLMIWVRKPTSRPVRIPLAVLLVVGGIFSFLPVLGLWMLPLGLMLIAQDIPFLQEPTTRMLGWIERKWMERRAAKRTS